jgi:hypothetical protein
MRDIRANDLVKVKPVFADAYSIDPDTVFIVQSTHETRYGRCIIIFNKYDQRVAYQAACFMIANSTVFILGDAEE